MTTVKNGEKKANNSNTSRGSENFLENLEELNFMFQSQSKPMKF